MKKNLECPSNQGMWWLLTQMISNFFRCCLPESWVSPFLTLWSPDLSNPPPHHHTHTQNRKKIYWQKIWLYYRDTNSYHISVFCIYVLFVPLCCLHTFNHSYQNLRKIMGEKIFVEWSNTHHVSGLELGARLRLWISLNLCLEGVYNLVEEKRSKQAIEIQWLMCSDLSAM